MPIQNAVNSLLATGAVALGAGKKLASEHEQAIHSKVLEQDALQDEYLANKDVMTGYAKEIKNISSGMREGKYDDIKAAEDAIGNYQTKLLAKQQLNARIKERFDMLKKHVTEPVVRKRKLLTGEEK